MTLQSQFAPAFRPESETEVVPAAWWAPPEAPLDMPRQRLEHGRPLPVVLGLALYRTLFPRALIRATRRRAAKARAHAHASRT